MDKLSVEMKKLTAIVFIGLIAVPAFSQFTIKKSKAVQDYVVTLEQDTLWGEIRYGNHVLGSRLNKIILFDNEGEKRKFKAFQLNGFRNHGNQYSSIDLDGYKYFARKVVSGPVNMYYFEYSYASNYDNRYFSENDEIGLNGKTVTVLLERNGITQRIYRKKVYQDVFPFLGDNPEIMQSVMKGECTFDELSEVVAAYNDWLSEK